MCMSMICVYWYYATVSYIPVISPNALNYHNGCDCSNALNYNDAWVGAVRQLALVQQLLQMPWIIMMPMIAPNASNYHDAHIGAIWQLAII